MLNQASILIREPRAGDGDGLARSWIDAAVIMPKLDPDLLSSRSGWTCCSARNMGVAYYRRGDAGPCGSTQWRGGRLHPRILSRRSRPPPISVRNVALTRVTIDALIVQQAYWRHGIGTQPYWPPESWGRSQNAIIALLDTYSESPISIPFYEATHGLSAARRALAQIAQLTRDRPTYTDVPSISCMRLKCKALPVQFAAQHRIPADAAARPQDRWHFTISFCVDTCPDLQGGAAECWPFGRWATRLASVCSWMAGAILNARCAGARGAEARCAGVGRTPVVQTARGAERDRVLDVVPTNARRAR